MAISNLLSAYTSSRTGRPRPLSSFGILAIPGGSRFLPRFLFSPPENGSYLAGGEDDLPSGGGGCGIGGEESANASSEDALAKALHDSTKEDNDTVSSCLGSAIRAVGIHSNIGNSNDEIEIIMTPQNILQQIANLLSQNARSQTMITDLLEKIVSSQTMITELLEQTVKSQTTMADLLEQTVNRNARVQTPTMTGVVANISIDDDLVKKRKAAA